MDNTEEQRPIFLTERDKLIISSVFDFIEKETVITDKEGGKELKDAVINLGKNPKKLSQYIKEKISSSTQADKVDAEDRERFYSKQEVYYLMNMVFDQMELPTAARKGFINGLLEKWEWEENPYNEKIYSSQAQSKADDEDELWKDAKIILFEQTDCPPAFVDNIIKVLKNIYSITRK